MLGPCSKGLVPTRAIVAIMLFFACFVSYMLRVNMSINIIAMVEPQKTNGTVNIPECKIILKEVTNDTLSLPEHTGSQNYGQRFDWDSKLQGLILGSYFWGSCLTSIPGGFLAERFGPRTTVLVSTLIGGLLTILGPAMAQWHSAALIASRFIVGLCGGVIYPSLHCMVSRWAPPEEKGKFVGALLGGTLGTVCTWPLLGAIIEKWGWTWSFYVNGAIVIAWCLLWLILVADSPDVHPRITDDEKIFIAKSLGDSVKNTKLVPPYKDMATSIPFWALIILHYGSLWGLFFLMTAGPSYLSSVLGFNLGHTGFLASLPHLARLIFGILFGLVGDWIRKRDLIAVSYVRKCFILFSHFIPGILLLVINLVGCDVNWSIALLTLSLGSNGAATLTNLQNAQDLAPNFAGTLYGTANAIGSTTGFLTPLIVAYITEEHNGLHEWHIIFAIGAGVYILCGVIFCIFGSGNMQKWNDKEKSDNGVENPAFEHEITNGTKM